MRDPRHLLNLVELFDAHYFSSIPHIRRSFGPGLPGLGLGRRHWPARPPDHEELNRALVRLAREMAASPQSVLQKLVETALTLCQAHLSGISLLEEENGRKIFRWHCLAGRYAPTSWVPLPREFSPCGMVLDMDAVQLMSYLDCHYEYFKLVEPRIVEALLVPFHVDGEAVGTIWVQPMTKTGSSTRKTPA